MNNVGIINARCHFIESSQQKVEPAALMRDSGNSNQHENEMEAPNCFQHSHATLFNLYPASLAVLRAKTVTAPLQLSFKPRWQLHVHRDGCAAPSLGVTQKRIFGFQGSSAEFLSVLRSLVTFLLHKIY